MVRNGMFRAQSVFTVCLSFAEFNAMVAPLAVLYVVHTTSARDRMFAFALLVATLAGIFVSGSRGGYVSAFAAFLLLFGAWIVRKRRFAPQSMSLVLGLVIGCLGFVGAILLVNFWGRAHNIVLGGGEEQLSNDGRSDQWALAWPKIFQNPITGHGYGMGGEVIGCHAEGSQMNTVDSWLLSALVETGVPGAVLFFGMLIVSIWCGLKLYVYDQSRYGTLAGGLACSLAAFVVYKLVLTQVENFTLFYIFIACIMFLNYYYIKSDAAEKKSRLSGGAEFATKRLILRGRSINYAATELS